MNDMERLDWPDGDWVDLRKSYGWAANNRIHDLARFFDNPGGYAPFIQVLAEETVAAINLHDADGAEIKRDDPTIWERIPDDKGDRLRERLQAIWIAWEQHRKDPKGTTAPSGGSRPG